MASSGRVCLCEGEGGWGAAAPMSRVKQFFYGQLLIFFRPEQSTAKNEINNFVVFVKRNNGIYFVQ